MEQPILLRLTLENMQYQIVQAIYPQEVELKEQVTKTVQKAIDTFDFEAEIQRQVASTLHSHVYRQVEYAIQGELNKKDNPYIEKIIEAEVEKQLKKAKY